MKNIKLLFIFFFITSYTFSQSLVISQYIEPSGGSGFRGIELYNNSNVAIVITSTNRILISKGDDGAACVGEYGIGSSATGPFPTINPGQVIVIGTANLVAAAIANDTGDLAFTRTFNLGFNGNDALQVFLGDISSTGGVLQDTFGTCGIDPGTAWDENGISTVNDNLEILPSVCASGSLTGWSDPGVRFNAIAQGNDATGFGVAPICFSTTALGIGDIAITGVKADNPDEFSFVLLTDVLNGTEINFTDKGWVNTGSFRTGAAEGVVTWVADTDLPCGTEIIITETGINSNLYNVNFGTATESDNGFALATAGDQIIAYQGTLTTPTLLYAIFLSSNTGWTNAVNANTSAVPSGLTDGTNAVYIGNFDNGNYNCAVTSGSALILAAVSTDTNWIGDDLRPAITLGTCSYICNICSMSVTWDGAVWSNGTGPSSSIAAIISGNFNTSAANPGFTTCSLTIDSGFTLTVDENYTVEVVNDVSNDGTITVLETGSFVQINEYGSFTNVAGTSSVTKLSAFASDWLEYTYWSSPVIGETIGNALSPANPNRRFRFRAENFEDNFAETNNMNPIINMQDDEDDNGNDWILVNGSDAMIPGTGYAATLSTTAFSPPPGGGPAPPVRVSHEFIGEFNNGIIPVTIYRNDLIDTDKNWNLIGNPYPSALSIVDFFAENMYNPTNTNGTIDGVVYYWSHENPPLNSNNGNSQNNFSQSDYVLVNEMGGTAAGDHNGDGTIDANDTPDEFIPSGQGFFVTYNDAAPGTASSITSLDPGAIIIENTVTFRNSMRVSGNNDLFFRTTNQPNTTNKLWLNMITDTGVFSQILVGYKDGATNDLDAARYDAIRNRSVGNQTFFYSTIENSNDNYSIQGKAPESLTLDEVIPLGLYTTIDNPAIYSISISHFEGDFFNTNTIYLKDNYTSVVIHDLNASDYSFTSASGEFRDRFEIVFNASSLPVDSFNVDASNLTIVELQDDNVQFSVPGAVSIQSVRIIDILGRELYNFRGSENTEIYNLSKLSSAPYIAQITLNNGNIISKKAIKR